MKKLFIFLIFSVLYIQSNAQIVVYITYQDYLNKIGQKMDESFYSSHETTSWHRIKLRDSLGKYTYFYPKEFWGITYKDKIIRTVKGELAMLMDTGRINYWVNGYAALQSLINPNSSFRDYSKYESHSFLSSGDINAKIYRMPINIMTMRDWSSYKKDFPDYEDLADCVSFSHSNWTGNNEMIRDCVLASNKVFLKRKLKK